MAVVLTMPTSLNFEDEKNRYLRIGKVMLYHALREAAAIGMGDISYFRSECYDGHPRRNASIAHIKGILQSARCELLDWIKGDQFYLCYRALGIAKGAGEYVVEELINGRGLEHVTPLLSAMRSLYQGAQGRSKRKGKANAKNAIGNKKTKVKAKSKAARKSSRATSGGLGGGGRKRKGNGSAGRG